MQNKTSVFDQKKVVTRFDEKNSDTAEKEHWWREESITADHEEEDPISEENPINEKPKEDPYHSET